MRHLLNAPRCALWAGMGMGKSVATLTALDALYFAGVESQPTLILAPLRVAKNTWPSEAAKWDHFSHIEVSPIVGDVKERAAALRRDASVFTMNYENLPWLVEHLGEQWPFGTVVCDEATRIKNLRTTEQTSKTGKKFMRASGGVRARGLSKLAHTKIHRWINLTGTPAPNGLQDLWGQTWPLDAGARLGRTFEGFKQRWFRPKYDGYGVEPLPFAQDEIQERVKDICLSIRAEDWFDVKAPIVRDVVVHLPPKARQLYRDMEKQMFMQLDGHDVEAFNAASRTIKCLQIASGAAFTDAKSGKNREWSEIHDLKLQALESILHEAGGMPVLVAYWFQPTLQRLRKAFPKARMLDASKQTEDDWNAGKIPMLLAHWQSAGHGLNLQDGGNIIVYIDQWWDLELYQQILERIGPMRQLQSGHNRNVWVYRIVAEGTVDEDVLIRHETKAEVQDILMAAAARRAA